MCIKICTGMLFCQGCSFRIQTLSDVREKVLVSNNFWELFIMHLVCLSSLKLSLCFSSDCLRGCESKTFGSSFY